MHLCPTVVYTGFFLCKLHLRSVLGTSNLLFLNLCLLFVLVPSVAESAHRADIHFVFSHANYVLFCDLLGDFYLAVGILGVLL